MWNTPKISSTISPAEVEFDRDDGIQICQHFMSHGTATAYVVDQFSTGRRRIKQLAK